MNLINQGNLTNQNYIQNKEKIERTEEKIQIGNQRGLFAHALWDNIKESSDTKLTNFDLQKELQNIDYYSEVKLAAMNKERNNQNLLNQDQEIAKVINPINMSRVMKARMYRDELELMYRSSKMNEIRTNIMNKTDSFYNNVEKDQTSIIKYLPPQENKNHFSIDLNGFPIIKKRNLIDHSKSRKSIDYNIFGLNNQDRTSKIEKKKLKLKFLEDSSFQDYLNLNDEPKRNLNKLSKVNESIESSKNKKESVLKSYNKFPPLTLSALMEYKPLIKAPGIGEFENGQIRLFRFS